jgi:gpW
MPEPEDPCLEAQSLRNALRDLAMGNSVTEVSFGEDRVRYSSANIDTLRELLASAERRCLEQQEPSGNRVRYARPVMMRRY